MDGYLASNLAEHRDLTIICNGTRWYTHKVVVCSQSEFFRRACKGGFKVPLYHRSTNPNRGRNANITKEGRTNRIELVGDEPEVVSAMISFLYQPEYNVPTVSNPLLFHAKICTIADKYFIPPLQSYAKQNFAKVARCGWATSAFSETIALLYEFANDRLKDIILNAAVDRTVALYEENTLSYLQQAVLETPEFAADLAKSLAK